MPFPKGKYKVLTLDVPRDLMKILREESRKRKISVSRVASEKISEALKRLKEKA